MKNTFKRRYAISYQLIVGVIGTGALLYAGQAVPLGNFQKDFWAIGLFVIFSFLLIYLGFEAHEGFVSFDRISHVAGVLIFGPFVAAVINFVASFLWPYSLLLRGKRAALQAFTTSLFNAGMFAITILSAGYLYEFSGGPVPLEWIDLTSLMQCLVLFAVIQSVNFGMMCLMLFLDNSDVRAYATDWFSQLIEGGSSLVGIFFAVVYNAGSPEMALLFAVIISVFVLTVRNLVTTREKLTGSVREKEALVKSLESYQSALEEKVARRTGEIVVQKNLVELKNQELEKALKEIRDAEQRIIHSEKMASLGRFTAGIAHEINNPLTFIHGHIDHLRQNVILAAEQIDRLAGGSGDSSTMPASAVEETLRALDAMERGSERIKKIIANLRNFAMVDESEWRIVDLRDCVDTTLFLFESKSEQITFHKEFGDIPEIECHPAELNQMLFALILNAVEAIEANHAEGGGNLWIAGKPENGSVLLTIRDDGCGIPDEMKNKVFDPFFTSKAVGKGQGLGLSVVDGVVRKHNGRVSFESSFGSGTEFRIELPVRPSRLGKESGS